MRLKKYLKMKGANVNELKEEGINQKNKYGRMS